MRNTPVSIALTIIAFITVLLAVDTSTPFALRMFAALSVVCMCVVLIYAMHSFREVNSLEITPAMLRDYTVAALVTVLMAILRTPDDRTALVVAKEKE